MVGSEVFTVNQPIKKPHRDAQFFNEYLGLIDFFTRSEASATTRKIPKTGYTVNCVEIKHLKNKIKRLKLDGRVRARTTASELEGSIRSRSIASELER